MRQLGKTCLLALLLVFALCTLANAQDQKPKQRDPYVELKMNLVNYREPQREYETFHFVQGTVMVEKQLLSETPDIAREALARLDHQWKQMLAVLPRSSHANLTGVRIFLMYGPKAKGGGNQGGACYTHKDNPKFFKELDERWSNSVVIYCAESYLRDSESFLVHEFAHAFHLQQWSADHLDIYQAWARAVESGLYRNVTDIWGAKHKEAYARSNPREYFAELTGMYFVRGKYPPFTRTDLKAYDPIGYAMIEKMWNVADGKEKTGTIELANKKQAHEPSLNSLTQLLGKNVNSKEVQAFRDAMGAGLTTWKVENLGVGYYQLCSSRGISLEFDNSHAVHQIWLYAEGSRLDFKKYHGELPAGLSFEDARADVERKLAGSERKGFAAGYYIARLKARVLAQILMHSDREGDRIWSIVIRREFALPYLTDPATLQPQHGSAQVWVSAAGARHLQPCESLIVNQGQPSEPDLIDFLRLVERRRASRVASCRPGSRSCHPSPGAMVGRNGKGF